MKIFYKIKLFFSSLLYSFVLFLPDEFSKYRIRYYNRQGCVIDRFASISPNVRIRGKFHMEQGSSIAQNCTISGENAGVFVGKNVMIAPNVVIVAFNHGYESTSIPMSKQKNTEDAVIIEDDVWIAANCTISKGVKIGKGAIIAANSFVNKNVPDYCIFGGVPAKFIRKRV